MDTPTGTPRASPDTFSRLIIEIPSHWFPVELSRFLDKGNRLLVAYKDLRRQLRKVNNMQARGVQWKNTWNDKVLSSCCRWYWESACDPLLREWEDEASGTRAFLKTREGELWHNTTGKQGVAKEPDDASCPALWESLFGERRGEGLWYRFGAQGEKRTLEPDEEASSGPQ